MTDLTAIKSKLNREIKDNEDKLKILANEMQKKEQDIRNEIQRLQLELKKYEKNPYIIYDKQYLRVCALKNGVDDDIHYMYCDTTDYFRDKITVITFKGYGFNDEKDKPLVVYKDSISYYDKVVKVEVISKEDFLSKYDEYTIRIKNEFDKINIQANE